MQPNDSIVDLLLEIQALDRVPRLGWALRGVARPESVAEHSFHVALLVGLLADSIDEVDSGRAVRMALLHDIAEVRLGDLPMTAGRYLSPGAKRRAEEAVDEELLAPLPASMLELTTDYRSGESPEARLVKACDKLALMLKVTVYESWGEGSLAEFWENPKNFPDGGFAPVRELFEDLRARRSRQA